MKYILRLFCCLSCLYFSACTTIKELNYTVDAKEHSVEALRNDVDFVYNKLQKEHPGIYWYTSKATLDFKFDSLKRSIVAPLKTKELYVKIAPVVAAINCGHTRVLLVIKKYSKKEQDSINKIGIKPIDQFTYLVKDSKLFIRANKSDDSTLKAGTEILEINNEPAARLITNIEASIPSDGYNKTFKEAVLNRAFAGWYASIYGQKDSLNFKFLNGNTVLRPRKPRQVMVKPKPLTAEEKAKKKQAEKDAKRSRYKGFDEYKKPNLEMHFLNLDSSAAYVKIKSFSFPYADFDRFYKETFTALKKAKTKDLIIDLRDNGGGSLTACRNLFAYLVDKDFVYLQPAEAKGRFVNANGSLIKSILAPFIFLNNLIQIKKAKTGKYYATIKGTEPIHPKKDHFDGQVYVIINGYTFSASTLFSANLIGNKRAIFVGTEAGGGFNQCTAGRIPIIDLPNTKLKLRFGLYRIAPVAQSAEIGRSIFPDVVIKRTIEDDINNKDPELDYILDRIKKKGNV